MPDPQCASITSLADATAARQARAWLALASTLALHVVDEALTDFLGFYNPLVLRIRSNLPWFPLPTFTIGVWLTGLATLVTVLVSVGPAVRRGAFGTQIASWALSTIMFLNGLGHLAGSAYFGQWLPGATSAPLLLVASVWLGYATWLRESAAVSLSAASKEVGRRTP